MSDYTVYALIWLLLHCLVFFSRKYCLDQISFIKGKATPFLPSVQDLDNSADQSTIERYKKEVIEPLSNYKWYDQELKPRVRDSSESIMFVFFEVISFILSIKCLGACMAEGISAFWAYLFATAILFAVCYLLHKIINFVYKHSISIRPFSESPDELAASLKYRCNQFPISYERFRDNHIIRCYLYYYQANYAAVHRRKTLLPLLDGIAAVVYILFFFRTP